MVGLSGPRKAANTKPGTAKTAADRVDFSTVLQEVSKSRENEAVDGARATKVAELREQIAKGTYRPDMDKVAASLIKFMDSEG